MSKKETKPKPEHCKLGLLIREYIAAKKAAENQPKRPSPPIAKNHYTVNEWNQYMKDQKDYGLKLEKFNEQGKALTINLEAARRAIVEHLPKTLTWFVTEDKRFAVALQTSDWPGDQAAVKYRENPVIDQLQPLRMQIIN